MLALFQKHGVKATFFITGFYAEREPADVRRIAAAGHEIAAHGYEHHYRGRVPAGAGITAGADSNFNLRKDVQKAKEVLEGISGQPVKGFRAPQAQYSQHLLQVLEEAGYDYDSSLHPAYLPGYYNHRRQRLQMHMPPGRKIIEVPVAVMPRSRLPIVWMFMRNLGTWWTQRGVEALLRRGISPNLYFHSWEFTEMRCRQLPGYFTRNTGKKFLRMMEKFITLNKSRRREFVPLGDILNGKV